MYALSQLHFEKEANFYYSIHSKSQSNFNYPSEQNSQKLLTMQRRISLSKDTMKYTLYSRGVEFALEVNWCISR